MQFTSQILVERTRTNERASVKEQGVVHSKCIQKKKKKTFHCQCGVNRGSWLLRQAR